MLRHPRILIRMACALLIGAGPAPAQDAGSLPGWRAALSSGSDRLALFSLGRLAAPDAGPLISALGQRTGGAHLPGTGVQVIARQVEAQPILSYSSNFNGGIPARSVTISGLEFVFDPEDRAKSGLVVGASVGAGLVASYAPGSVLRLSGRVRAEALPAHDLYRTQIGLSLCAQHLLGGWTWLDGCASYGLLRRNYDQDETIRSLSIGPTQVFHAGGIDQQLSARLSVQDQGAGRQPGLGLQWIGAVPGIGAVEIGGQVNQSLPGEQTRLREVRLSLARPVAGREMRFELELGRDGGARFAGIDRHDRVTVLRVDTPLTDRIGLSAGLGRRDSTVDLYDETIAEFGLRLLDW